MNTDIILLTTSISIIVGLLAIIKFLFDLKKELTNVEAGLRKELSDFKDEVRKELTELKIENIKMQARFDKYNGVNTELDKRVAEIQKQQTELQLEIAKNEGRISEIQAQSTATDKQVVASENRINAKLQQVETENRDFIKELVQTVSH